ncbi:hypothetical protein ZWY2020_013005 [Hordeum vulgare]|nr:hypothetical protein ZWY2020_013005 [Hordeum vulgare]
MPTMMCKLVVTMLLVLMATTSGSSARAAARPFQGDQVHAWEPHAGGSIGIVLPSPMHWRGRVLSQLEDKGANGCPKSHDHTLILFLPIER